MGSGRGVTFDATVGEVDTEDGVRTSHSGPHIFRAGPVLGVDVTLTQARIPKAELEVVRVDVGDESADTAVEIDQGIEFLDGWQPPVGVTGQVEGPGARNGLVEGHLVG